MQEIFERLYQKQDLTASEMTQLATNIFNGAFTDSQLGAILTLFKLKKPTAVELTALTQVMRQHAKKIDNPPPHVMDNCGTGGDYSNSFNISTTTAFVLAAAGIPMAKHGNRSISSKSGSADVLEILGVNLTTTPEEISQLLHTAGIAFLFAPSLHPKMQRVGKIRKELATATIFNLIGPLTNPVPLETQLMGTFAGDYLVTTAETLAKLHRKRAIVLQGSGGMDEANLAGPTNFALLADGHVTEHTFHPEEASLPTYDLTAITGGNAQKNAEILLAVLKNQPSPYLDTVRLNAGFGLYAHGSVPSIVAGIALASQILASGAAYDKLQALIHYQQEVN